MRDPFLHIVPIETVIRQEGVDVIGEVAVDEFWNCWGQHQP